MGPLVQVMGDRCPATWTCGTETEIGADADAHAPHRPFFVDKKCPEPAWTPDCQSLCVTRQRMVRNRVGCQFMRHQSPSLGLTSTAPGRCVQGNDDPGGVTDMEHGPCDGGEWIDESALLTPSYAVTEAKGGGAHASVTKA